MSSVVRSLPEVHRRLPTPFSFGVLYGVSPMFTIQYWNPREAQWLGCGEPQYHTRDEARAAIARLREQCDYCVRFRAWGPLVPGTTRPVAPAWA